MQKRTLSTDIGEQPFQLRVGHGVALGEIAQRGAKLPIWTSILGDDNRRQLGIGILDAHGILQLFLIHKHGQSPSFFLNSQGQGSSSQR